MDVSTSESYKLSNSPTECTQRHPNPVFCMAQSPPILQINARICHFPATHEVQAFQNGHNGITLATSAAAWIVYHPTQDQEAQNKAQCIVPENTSPFYDVNCYFIFSCDISIRIKIRRASILTMQGQVPQIQCPSWRYLQNQHLEYHTPLFRRTDHSTWFISHSSP